MGPRWADGRQHLAEPLLLHPQVNKQSGEQEAAVKNLFAKYGTASAKPFFAKAGIGAFKVHRTVVDGSETLPQLWRAQCGVRFGLWNFTRHASAHEFPPDARCDRCFGQRARTSPLAPAGVESASAAGSAGSDSEVDEMFCGSGG